MRRLTTLAIVAVIAAGLAGCAGEAPGTLTASQAALATNEMRSIEYSGTGKWFQFGQAPNPTLPWPQFDVSSYTAAINYETPAARVQMTRKQVVEPGRRGRRRSQQRPVQMVSGTHAWNMAAPAGAAAGTRARAAAAARGRRRADDGDLDDAAWIPEGGGRQQRDVAAGGGRLRGVVHDGRKHRYVGTHQRAEPGRARADLDRQPGARRHAGRDRVLGLSRFRRRACSRRASCGRRAAIRCSTHGLEVTANPAVDIPVPDVRSFTPPPVTSRSRNWPTASTT